MMKLNFIAITIVHWHKNVSDIIAFTINPFKCRTRTENTFIHTILRVEHEKCNKESGIVFFSTHSIRKIWNRINDYRSMAIIVGLNFYSVIAVVDWSS